ncbi:hypothetical protein H5T88_05975 [bacterium]|nr:hypothetical protein [bacterium]
MRGFCLFLSCFLIAIYMAQSLEKEEDDEYICFKARNYVLRLYKNKGTFDFLLIDGKGDLKPIHNPSGESPWFGYNCARGEIRSSQNAPEKIEVGSWKYGYKVSLIYPLEEGAYYEGNFYIADDFLAVRSLIDAVKREGVNIVRLAPRFEVDINLFNHFAFSIPKALISGEVSSLGRPGYAGVWGWGGPKSFSSLDPDCPFFALFNPDLKLCFLFLYPFYDKLWKNKHIFLQLWEGGINYFYSGWGEEKDLGKEVLFAIAPLNIPNPEGISQMAKELMERIEAMVKGEELPCPSLLNALKAEESVKGIWRKSEESLNKQIPKLEVLSPREFGEWKSRIYQIQHLFFLSKLAFERGDYENSLIYARKMLKILEEKEE